jgi:hypothetical protein
LFECVRGFRSDRRRQRAGGPRRLGTSAGDGFECGLLRGFGACEPVWYSFHEPSNRALHPTARPRVLCSAQVRICAGRG